MGSHATRRLYLRLRSPGSSEREQVAEKEPRRSAGRLLSRLDRRWTAPQVRMLQRRAGNHATGKAIDAARPAPAIGYMPQTTALAAAVMGWPLLHRRNDVIRRITIPRTTTTNSLWDRVPNNHLARVEAAVAIINRQLTSRRLINYFRDNAPGGTENTLQQVANRAKVWELRTAGDMGRGEVGGDNMAYDRMCTA